MKATAMCDTDQTGVQAFVKQGHNRSYIDENDTAFWNRQSRCVSGPPLSQSSPMCESVSGPCTEHPFQVNTQAPQLVQQPEGEKKNTYWRRSNENDNALVGSDYVEGLEMKCGRD